MKEFVVRKHLRKPIRTFFYVQIYLITFIVMFAIVINLSFGLSKTFIQEFNRIYGLIVSSVVAIVIISFLFIYYIYFIKLKYVKVILNDDYIKYTSSKKEIVINYDDIVSVNCSHFKYSRGWIKIKSNNDLIKLTVSLENIAIFIKMFKEKLDDRGLEEVYNSKRMYDFYKTASYSDDSWERIYELLKFVPPATGFGIVISFIFSFLVEGVDAKFLVILLTFIFPELVLLLSEAILVIKHTIDMKKEKYIIRMRDYQYEHRVFDAVFVLLLIALIIILSYLAMKC